MLSLDEKRSILHSFNELREKEDQYGRFFYYYDASPTRKKLIAYEFSQSGNGYVYGLLLPEYKGALYKDGSVCVKDYTSEELREIIRKSIRSLQKLGRKPVGQTASAGFQVGVRRTFPISKEEAWTFMTAHDGLSLWLGELTSFNLDVGHRYESKVGISGEFRVINPFHHLRMTWQKKEWEKPSTLQIRFLSSNDKKTTISFHQEKLADVYVREEMKSYWEDVLAKVKEKITI